MVLFGKLLADTLSLPFDAAKDIGGLLTGEEFNNLSSRAKKIYKDLEDE